MMRLYNEVFEADINRDRATTTEIGKRLEDLIIYMFSICKCLKGAPIKTGTNQIDGYFRNTMFMQYGVFRTLGGRFIIECKNENRKPSGEYLQKLFDIINRANASDQAHISLGIFASIIKGPKTFKTLSREYYLTSKVKIICFCKEDLADIINNGRNLLDIIEKKIDEVALDITTDLDKTNVYR